MSDDISLKEGLKDFGTLCLLAIGILFITLVGIAIFSEEEGVSIVADVECSLKAEALDDTATECLEEIQPE